VRKTIKKKLQHDKNTDSLDDKITIAKILPKFLLHKIQVKN